MNEEEFLTRVAEVSEWHRPQTRPNGCDSVSKGKNKPMPEHPGPITELELEEMSEHEVKVYYDKLLAWREAQPNNSVPPEIIRVKTQPVDCPDCGLHCPLGRRTEKKLHESGSKHWRERCVNCDTFRDPLTGQFTLSKQASHQYFIQFYKPKLGKYKSKYQPKLEVKEKATRPNRTAKLTKSQIMEQIINEGTWHTVETDTSIIRRFEPKK